MMRVCTRCGAEKPRTSEFFGKDARACDGLVAQCRLCRSAAASLAGATRRKRVGRSTAGTRFYALMRRTGVRLSKYKHLGHGIKPQEALGCSYAEFAAHLEARFAPGMGWDNAHLWHLDHKRPLAAFDLINPREFLAAFHHSNVQPLWAEANLAKGAAPP